MKKLLFIVIFFPLTVWTQSFTASVDENPVAENQQFQVSFTFSGKDMNGIDNFKAPSFSNFLLLSGPNQSTSIQFINGTQSASISYTYIVRARDVGKYTLGKASIDYNGKTYETDPLQITVVKGSPQSKKQNSQDQNTGVSNEEIAKNLFIRAQVDKKKVYQGEQVTVIYKLYTRLNIAAQMSINKLPQYKGFWAEELETSTNIIFKTEVVDGKQFRVGVLKKAALFPSQTGKLEVTPFELTVPIQVRKNRNRDNFFDDFFNDPFGMNQTVEYNAVSNKVTIDVLPLPSEGKPDSFNGAVGDFSFDTSIDKTTAKTNEPITLKLTVSGKGNMELLEVPKLNLPSGFEQYEPKTSEQINRQNIISGKKTFEYLLIPRVVGNREIPPIEFSYFNPKKKRYYTLKSKPYTINITQGENLPEVSYTSKEDVRQLRQDIRFIKTSDYDIHKKEESVLFTTFFWVGGIVPMLLLFVVVGWKRRHDKLTGNLSLLRYRRAQKVAKNRLKKAKKLMQSNNHNEFYTEIFQALFGYLEDKLHISKAEFTIDRAVDELKKLNVEDDLSQIIRKTAEDCEYARFAPGADKSATMQVMYDQLAKAIIEVEKNIADANAK